MFETYQNSVLCVHAGWLVSNILTKPNYDALVRRGHLNRLQRAGNGRPALIEFDTMPAPIKEKIVAVTGDPSETAHHIKFMDYLKHDHEAVRFYQDYPLENGEHLPEKNIKEYSTNASILNGIGQILASVSSRRSALGTKLKPWPRISEIVNDLPRNKWPHSLPSNHRKLKQRFDTYVAEGYASLIHKGFCSRNAEKLGDEAKRWVLARWADQVQRCATYAQLLCEYNEMAPSQGWKTLKSDQTLQAYLQDPNVEPLWWGYRFGELKAKERFSFQHSTKLPSMRDSLWYSDGTKLNYYYQDENGKPQTCQVYEVFDAYSEVFLGFHISKSEDYEAQYHAYKMALQISGHKPYEIKYDGQGGHSKLKSTSFLGKISRLAIRTQPYNGKSKTIESAFGRFQQQFLKQDWFFTGQNVTAKKNESKANMEFILANAKNLPTLDQVKATYEQRRREWNQAPHPKTGEPRLEMYLKSENPQTPKVDTWTLVDMFWIQKEEPVTCTPRGISFKLKGHTYEYLVYDENRFPNIEWLRYNVGEKFVVKYDPDDLSMIQLYKDGPLGLRHVAAAETKVITARNRQEMDEWEASYYKKVEQANKTLRVADRDKMEEVLAEHSRRAEDYGLNRPALKGLESSKKQKTDIGTYQKKVSEAVLTDDIDEVDIYSKM